MKARFWLFKRGNVYYVEDTLTRRQESLHTGNRRDAERLRDAKNDAVTTPTLGLALARTYLSAHDPQSAKRTWAEVMRELASHGREPSQQRCQREMRSQPFDLLRDKLLIETTAQDFLEVLRCGTTSTNHYLRRLHNLAVGLGWLPWPVLAPKLWPTVRHKPKRAITWAEHERIVSTEGNVERRRFYELLWETGAAQTDAATLQAENIDWNRGTLTYRRHKTGQTACLVLGSRLRNLLAELPNRGPLFPQVRNKNDSDRAGEFRRRCRILEIRGVTLHSYRYAWAQRAKISGYPERWAQAALGHNSRAVHEAYARGALVACPPLEEYEKKVAPSEATTDMATGTGPH